MCVTTENQDTNLTELLAELVVTLEAERAARARRCELEAKIAAIHQSQMPVNGGSKSFVHNGVKFSVKQDYTFKADLDEIKKLPCASALVKTEEKFNASAYKKLWEFNKETAQVVAAFVVATPSKPAVTLAGKEDE